MTKWDKALSMVDFEVCLHSRFNPQLYKPHTYGFSFRLKLPQELQDFIPDPKDILEYIQKMALEDGYIYKDLHVQKSTFEIGTIDCCWSEWGPI